MVLHWILVDKDTWQCEETKDYFFLVKDYGGLPETCHLVTWTLLVLEKGGRMADARMICALPTRALLYNVMTTLMENIKTKKSMADFIKTAWCTSF